MTTPIGSSDDDGRSVALQSDGKIVVAGFSYNASGNADFGVVRYTSMGALDTSFNGTGKVTTPIGSGSDVGSSVAVQSDGKIVVAGYSYNGSNDDFALVRYEGDPTALKLWRTQYFGSPENSGDGADLADPDQDELANLVEFATAQDPTQPGPAPMSDALSDSSIAFIYTRNKAALGVVQFTVEWSDSLTSGSWSTAGITENIFNDDGITQQVKAGVPLGTGNRIFVRLRISIGQ